VISLSAPDIGKKEIRAVVEVLKSGKLAQGEVVASFENEFSKLHNGWHAIATNSGTSALHLALLSFGIGPGDEVIVPSFTFAATANAVRLTGAEPVFADIDKDYFCIDPSCVEKLISPQTKAIIPVHLYGQISDISRLKDIATKHNLLLVEDAAQAHFAELSGVRAGNLGDAAAFSFYPTKNMTSGEGGMILTQNEKVVRLAKLYRNQGMIERYKNEVVGFNYRMTDIHAAIGRVQLQKLGEYTDSRSSNASFLSSNLENVITPKVRLDSKHVFHQYTIVLPDLDRDSFCTELRERGVDCGVYYPVPVHKLPSFQSVEELPITNYVSNHCLSLPVHPKLTTRELEKIVTTVNLLAKAGA
jgi:perosamine synthetase